MYSASQFTTDSSARPGTTRHALQRLAPVIHGGGPRRRVHRQRLQRRIDRAVRGADSHGPVPRRRFESVRFSLGRFTTPDDIEIAIESAIASVERVRAMT